MSSRQGAVFWCDLTAGTVRTLIGSAIRLRSEAVLESPRVGLRSRSEVS